MLKVQVLKRGGVSWGSLSDVKPSSKFIWIDALKPSKHDIEKISEATKIPIEDLEEASDEDERPRVFDADFYSYIVFRAPLVEKKGVKVASIAMFFYKNMVVTLRNFDHDAFKTFYGLTEEKRKFIYQRGVSYFIFRLLDEVLGDYFGLLDSAEEKIEKIETKVFRRPDKSTVRDIFQLKKTLIYFHKALAANRDVISSIEKEYVKNIEKSQLKRFRNLYHDIAELIDIQGTYMDILTGALDIYLSSVSNNINIVMKRMTALGSFVLIPTLISGIYGMNFKHMPELYWTYGYFFAIGIMLFAIIFSYIYFKRKDWL